MSDTPIDEVLAEMAGGIPLEPMPKTHYADPDTLATLNRLERENADLRAELEQARKDAAIFREVLIHLGSHMQTDEQFAYMPLNEWIGHASVEDARKRDRELIDAAIAQGKGEK